MKNRKKRIVVLHAQVPFVRGGAELMVEALTMELKKRGYDAELVSIPFRWYPENGLYDNMMMWRMTDLKEMQEEKIDLVIPTKFPTYGIEHPNKMVWLMHQFRSAYDLYDKKDYAGLAFQENGARIRDKVKTYDETVLKEAKGIYTISQNVSDRLLKFNNIESSVLYHPPMLYGKYYNQEYGKYILSVGRLDSIKRNDLLIRSLKYCNSEIKAVIAGRGPEMDKLKLLAIKENVDHRVEFLGFVQDDKLLELYANAACVFYAPLDEDYGYITLEAFLSHKPVVTCEDAGGVLEFVNDGKNGMICKSDNLEDIGIAINRIVSDPVLAKEWGDNGYEKVKDISWDNVIDYLTMSIK